jgi:hypothetical protein
MGSKGVKNRVTVKSKSDCLNGSESQFKVGFLNLGSPEPSAGFRRAIFRVPRDDKKNKNILAQMIEI